ncbi:M4 family metallopeptidase [Thalassomonas actiniarum]|uniref:M4 family metallopeptidase n=1 Tax=Thalassomonas actiniarum TaxID=485447 RepID=A0AAE9YY38_9GAMM|nr:M4 family metallopeptidase [Thalassomonas actiniarum]WDE02555.1 M4 family metallopeptidase [Thalassomonas actiniarum]
MKKNKITVLLLALAAVSAQNALAAESINARKHLKQHPVSGVEMHSVLGLSAEHSFRVKSKRVFKNGKSKQRMSQYYRGVPVWGQSVATEVSPMGVLSDISGTFAQNIATDVSSVIPGLSEAQVKSINRKKNGDTEVSHETAELIIYIGDDNRAHLAYKTDYVVYSETPRRPTAIIDADNGVILLAYDAMAFAEATGPGGNEKTGQYYYGRDFPALNVTDDCRMDNDNVATIDMNHATSGGEIHQFTCPENLYKPVNGGYSALNDAHYFGGVVFDMYNDWYQSAPLQFKLAMRVHYGVDYENAFWDGQQMTFGDGLDRYYPLVSLDVVSHEISHGFTEQNSGLAYFSQSGGINESFSDVMGEVAKYYSRGSNDWHVGGDIFKADGALRYMDNPPQDGNSIDHADDYYGFMNVHYSSGVFNKAFYLLTNTPGWDIRMAGETYVVANQLYWQATSSFEDGACGVYTAARDLGYNLNDVETAFNGVGVAMCDEFSEERPPTPPEYTLLENGTVLTDLWSDDRVHLKYAIEVPEGATTLDVAISGPIVDTTYDNADLVIQYEGIPTPVDNLCYPGQPDNNESCSFSNPEAGIWYIVIEAQVSFEQLTLSVAHDGSDIPNPGEGDSGTESGLSASRNQWLYRTLEVPEGMGTLDVSLTGGTGDASLYLKHGSEPSNRNNDCRSRTDGNEESCIINAPDAGAWYIGLRGSGGSFDDVTMNWQYQP